MHAVSYDEDLGSTLRPSYFIEQHLTHHCDAVVVVVVVVVVVCCCGNGCFFVP
jgi:hypothetical protein